MSQNSPAGSLVITGGGLHDDNEAVFSELIRLAGGHEKASFAIIPSASGAALLEFERFKNSLTNWGIKPEKIYLIPIAAVDDDSTADVNEAAWIDNGQDPDLAEVVRNCSAVWFTGGDQNRTLKTLINPDGSFTPVLEAVWDVYRSGGVIGGTSAGAAIMSDPMIGGGSGKGALTEGVQTIYEEEDQPARDGVLVTQGLGFFESGIVDQHFEARIRIGRLVVALLEGNHHLTLGFGIDENTALIYSGATRTCSVAGASGVTILDASETTFSRSGNAFTVRNLKISRLENGDRYEIPAGEIIPAPGKKPITGNEYYNNLYPAQGGALWGHPHSLTDLLTAGLIDNRASSQIQQLNLLDNTTGYLLILHKTEESRGYYTDEPDREDHYTVEAIGMDIIPVKLAVHPIE